MFFLNADITNKKGFAMKKILIASIALLSMGCAATSDTAVGGSEQQKTAATQQPYNSQQVIKNEVNIIPPVQEKTKKEEKNQNTQNRLNVNSISADTTIDNTPVLTQSSIMTLQVEGLGVAPVNVESIPQAKVMARRAAIADAYRALAEKMYGIRVKGKETVRDLMLKNSEVRTDVYGLIRGACIQEESFKNGIYRVVMSLKLNVRKWNKYINNN